MQIPVLYTTTTISINLLLASLISIINDIQKQYFSTIPNTPYFGRDPDDVVDSRSLYSGLLNLLTN